jgi:DNA polymerase I-like protein with 3'-5' exonuclease and polymerase domains
MIKHEMEQTFQLDVPLEVDLGVGKIGWKRIKMIFLITKKSFKND